MRYHDNHLNLDCETEVQYAGRDEDGRDKVECQCCSEETGMSVITPVPLNNSWSFEAQCMRCARYLVYRSWYSW